MRLGNISIQQSLTPAPGSYNINSLSMTGNAQIIVTPPGAVTLNVAGIGQTTAVVIAGNGIVGDNVANDFIILDPSNSPFSFEISFGASKAHDRAHSAHFFLFFMPSI